MSINVLEQLARVIKSRADTASDKSYTRQLLDAGALHCAKKLGEEACEVTIAGVAQDDNALIGESADLLYHLLVLLEARGIALDDVMNVLSERMGTSGLAEKAARKK